MLSQRIQDSVELMRASVLPAVKNNIYCMPLVLDFFEKLTGLEKSGRLRPAVVKDVFCDILCNLGSEFTLPPFAAQFRIRSSNADEECRYVLIRSTVISAADLALLVFHGLDHNAHDFVRKIVRKTASREITELKFRHAILPFLCKLSSIPEQHDLLQPEVLARFGLCHEDFRILYGGSIAYYIRNYM